MSDVLTLVFFGEAEKGVLHRGVLCKSLPQLIDCYGHPPPSTQGLILAIQTLLYHRELIYFRVREEGYSLDDYYRGIEQIEHAEWESRIAAFGMPGVGDEEVFRAITPLCEKHHSLLITTQADLYDYLTG